MAKDENKESEIRGDEQEIVDQRLPVWRPQDADREYYRYETKKRIQHYTVPPQTIFRPAKPTPTIRDAEHKRVAVYARVSTKSKEQVSSIENQTKYYTEKIAKTPNWDLAEIYSDESAIIGLSQNPVQTGGDLALFFLFSAQFSANEGVPA